LRQFCFYGSGEVKDKARSDIHINVNNNAREVHFLPYFLNKNPFL
jgi:hypothetical protein